MAKLLLKGWPAGVDARPVSLADAFREELGLDLASAKGLLDELVESGSLLIPADSDETASRLQRRAEELGLVCERIA